MKLRILDDSLRLRLSRREVKELRDYKAIGAATHFAGGSRLRYWILTEKGRNVEARFSGWNITLFLPYERVKQWADGDDVSIRARQALSNGRTLHILVEKDFKCLTTREHEDESDLFPHPKEGDIDC